MSDEKQLNDDQLWDRAGTNKPITKNDMGIDTSISIDGLQTLNEGFNLLQFSDQSKKD